MTPINNTNSASSHIARDLASRSSTPEKQVPTMCGSQNESVLNSGEQKFKSDLSAATLFVSLSNNNNHSTMASQDDVPAVPVADRSLVNGVNGTVNGAVNGVNGDRRPETPTAGMSLTEYSANPSTPSEEKRARIRQVVPDEFLLPTGYPDVSQTLPD